ncbi:MAG: FkbM family methyltransferase [Actinobacteria bacterium]|nr:FkbM family methyltransferase [Actinomycetota bacterium]
MATVRTALIAAGNRLPPGLASRFQSQARVTRPARAIINRVLPDAPTLVTVRSGQVRGIRLLILPRSEKFLWTGTHEPEVQEAIANILQPGMTFWDVGSHVGYFTLLASRLVGPTGTVHAFEPMPETFRRLTTSLAANPGASNVVAHEVALSPTSGTAFLHGGDVSVLWSLRRGSSKTSVQVRCQTLAEACAVLGPPNLIKVDAEGAEIDILVSGRQNLAEHGIPILLETACDAEVGVLKQQLPFYRAERVNSTHWLLTVPPDPVA